MAGRKPQTIRPGAIIKTLSVADSATQRALDDVTDALENLQSKRQRDAFITSLIVGTNKIPHGLGRPVIGYTLTPTVADASFTHRIDRSNPNPEREVWIVVGGAAQPDATIETF